MAFLLKPHADKKPDETALIDEFGTTSWVEINQPVNRLIDRLRSAGLQTGDIFSVFSGNRREYYEAFAAASHAGWLLVPINWHGVAEEVAYILADSGSKALIADTRFADVACQAVSHKDAPQLNVSLMVGGEAPVGFLEYESYLAQGSAEEPDDQSLGGPMFYTSGTTGKPKGVRSGLAQTGAPIESLQMIGAGISGMLGLPEGGTTLLEGPVYHSAQWAWSFLPLLIGSSVVIRQKFDAAETLQLIDEYQVTNMHLVPTQFLRMLRLDDDIRNSFDGSSLQIIWHGAAPCPIDVKKQMIEWWGPIISEYYGSTEGSIVTTVNSEEWLQKPGSLGKPSEIMEIMILKDDGSPAAVNEAGQIYVKNKMGSDFEYHNDPDKTKEAHLEPGVFTFGDIGYLDEDGCLFMSDRKIDMIISGGVNIYPAEIEGILVNHPSVVDAAVFGIPNEDFGEEVKAAIELVDEIEPSDELAEELIAFCKDHLAGYKAPRSIDFEEALPRHPTGKLLKRLLRDAYWKDRGRNI